MVRDPAADSAPAPTSTHESKTGGTFSSLKIRNYRLFATGAVISNTGTWMSRITQDWLVLSLTGCRRRRRHHHGPPVPSDALFGLYGGIIADRLPKRRLLLISQAALGLCGIALAVLTLSGVVQVWHVYLIAFLLGMVTVVDNPARESFVSEMVGPAQLRNAVSLNSANFQSARLIGPAVAGVLITTVGSGWAFMFNGLSFLAPLVGLLMMRTSEMHASVTVKRAKGQLREGLRYVSGRPDLIWPIVLVGFVGTFGFNFPIFLTAFADEIFHGGAGMYSFFNILMAAGSLAGALLAARRRSSRLRMLVAAGTAFGLLEIAGGALAVRLAVRPAAGPDRHDRSDDQHHRQHQRPDGCRPGDAGPGDEPLHDGLRRWYAGGRPDRRLDQRRPRRQDRYGGRRGTLHDGRDRRRHHAGPRRRPAPEGRPAPGTPACAVRPPRAAGHGGLSRRPARHGPDRNTRSGPRRAGVSVAAEIPGGEGDADPCAGQVDAGPEDGGQLDSVLPVPGVPEEVALADVGVDDQVDGDAAGGVGVLLRPVVVGGAFRSPPRRTRRP